MLLVVQTQPVLTLEPSVGYLYAGSWSPSRPAVIALTTASGQLFIYDLKQNGSAPVVQLEAGTAKCPVYCVAFNHRQ